MNFKAKKYEQDELSKMQNAKCSKEKAINPLTFKTHSFLISYSF